jgi:GrpB-like predicted nucleotidyltransferase (UPF0157 family)
MWREYLRFRDRLRANPIAAQRYAELEAGLLVGRGGWYSGRDKQQFIARVPSGSEAAG